MKTSETIIQQGLSSKENIRTARIRAQIIAILSCGMISSCKPFSNRCTNLTDDPSASCFVIDGGTRSDTLLIDRSIVDMSVVDADDSSFVDIPMSDQRDSGVETNDVPLEDTVTTDTGYDGGDVISDRSETGDVVTDSADVIADRPETGDVVVDRDAVSTTLLCNNITLSSARIRVGEMVTIRLFVSNTMPADGPLSYFFGNLPASPTNMARSGTATYTMTAGNPPGPGNYLISGWATSPGGRRADCPPRNLEVTP